MTATRSTHQDLLPEETSSFKYELDEHSLRLKSTVSHELQVEMLFTGNPTGQQHHMAQFLFEIWSNGFAKGQDYQTDNPDQIPPTPAVKLLPATRRAVNLARGQDSRLEGLCPWCNELLRISVDVFYSRFTGLCPSCHKSVAYRAPDGTFRSDTIDPAPGVWLIDREQYCPQCRHAIPECQGTPPTKVPDDYVETSLPPWKKGRSSGL